MNARKTGLRCSRIELTHLFNLPICNKTFSSSHLVLSELIVVEGVIEIRYQWKFILERVSRYRFPYKSGTGRVRSKIPQT